MDLRLNLRLLGHFRQFEIIEDPSLGVFFTFKITDHSYITILDIVLSSIYCKEMWMKMSNIFWSQNVMGDPFVWWQ
jgi:hypothetical protein